ncbi:dienelactone hydrolase endo-1,3,1,4-beta-D-glucanase [Gymnopilus junonius]|uniref:Dienelactone hydrolase endo-1,3,1,4-beta-D-glucanase n=1 Tax=Gymnopilus junonius TaxID=109634 RepID=A0A9P5TG57_GYMJU|nr:dienelactone hydrolase endo-1,3,1,4-beta-D-glucanase [Gymnopilus junonius]
MSFCEHCVKGVIHEGTPTDRGVDSYVATPTVDYPKDKVVLFLPDVFGAQLINAQLMADAFAENGFKHFRYRKVVPNHGAAQTRPTLDKVINALKEQGVTIFGATGYCFGGRYVFDLAFENIIKAGVVAHPSLLQVPADLEKYFSTSKVPLLINSCPSQAKADEIFGDGKFAPGYKRNFYEGCTHGFAVRGDMSDPKVKAGKEGAFKETVEWFIKNL